MRHVDSELAAASRSIDLAVLGRRLRNARMAAGLTQADVAGGVVSAAYLSRIEAGQRRPEPKVLEQLAPKMGVSLEELVFGMSRDRRAELRLTLDYAELSLKTGAPGDALERAHLVEEQLTDSDPDLRRQAAYVRALAVEASAGLNDAISILEDLTADAVPDSVWLRATIALTRCYREAGDLERAIETSERALAQVADLGLDGLDESVQLAVTAASAYYEKGDVGRAVRLCGRAIEKAEALDSPIAMASAYWNASVMESEQGRVTSAISLAERALALLTGAEDNRNVARLHSQLGIFQLRLEPPDVDAAYANLRRAAEEMEWSSASSVDKARNQLALARALFYRQRYSEAEEQARACHDLAQAGAPLLSVDALVLCGQIAARNGDPDTARRQFGEAVAVLTGIGADRHAAQLWFQLAELLEQLGDHERALDAYRRGAASTGLTPANDREAIR